ncbi:MAG: SGNH/GDSL hydrolase family protein [Bacteroidota bacterium]
MLQIRILFILVVAFSCSSTGTKVKKGDKMTYLALGDSYTIGEAVSAESRWPDLLTKQLKEDSIEVDLTIVAKTGWTTGELKKGIAKADLNEKYDLVSLLIGVNNQYRGYSLDEYEHEFKELLSQALVYADNDPRRVFVVSIPDYGVTPFAAEKNLNPEKISDELHHFNAVAHKIARLRDVKFVDITEKSLDVRNDPMLIADDGLHPSGKMYEVWAKMVYEQVFQ